MTELDTYTLTAAKREFIQAIKDENLVLIPAEYGPHVMELINTQTRLLKNKSVSAYKVAKYRLIPNVTTVRTVKNMVADGRISPMHAYTDADGKLQIMTSAIKLLRN